jgi:hypothetical protein
MAVDRPRENRTRRWSASLLSTAFGAAFAAMLVAQLALMSVLSSERAEQAALVVSESRLTENLIEQTVRRAVGPLLTPELTAEVAIVASTDPSVREIVRSSLVSAHRQVVDPGQIAGTLPDGTVQPDGNRQVGSAIATVLTQAGNRSGVDLSGVAEQLDTPSVIPREFPEIGLGRVAERTRAIAAMIAVAMAGAALAISSRRGRTLSALGWRAGLICGIWAIALLAVGWVIGLIAETLFGELLTTIWAASVPAMIALLAAFALLSVGTWMGGLAVDGLLASSRPTPRRRPAPRPATARTAPTHAQPPIKQPPRPQPPASPGGYDRRV